MAELTCSSSRLPALGQAMPPCAPLTGAMAPTVAAVAFAAVSALGDVCQQRGSGLSARPTVIQARSCAAVFLLPPAPSAQANLPAAGLDDT